MPVQCYSGRVAFSADDGNFTRSDSDVAFVGLIMAIPYDPIHIAFESVIYEFKNKLQDDKLYSQILKITSIDEVYDATDKLQEEQAKSGHLRHLSKIEPYLERLREYSGVIDTLVQAKPDVLALIWGPIKLLLQWTSILKQSFDAIINITAEIGDLLPEFKEFSQRFSHNDKLKDVLVLFFQDILDFYLVALKFFNKPSKSDHGQIGAAFGFIIY